MFKLTRAMMLFTVPVFLVVVYGGGWIVSGGWTAKVGGLAFWLLLVAVTIVLRNTTPRLRTDQAVRFFWGPTTLVAVAAAALAWMGG
jgi:NADH-quinone oxidoreductase subunit H